MSDSDDISSCSAKSLSSANSFLQRWSARKAHTREVEKQLPQTSESAPKLPARELTDADMPALDSLDEHSDYSRFFSPQVSATLRRQALRKLFHSPCFNTSDGLDIYNEDYTCFTGLGDIITQEMRYRMKMETRRIAQSVMATAPVAGEDDSEAISEAPRTRIATEAAGDKQGEDQNTKEEREPHDG